MFPNGTELFTYDQNEASRRLINRREKRWIIRNLKNGYKVIVVCI